MKTAILLLACSTFALCQDAAPDRVTVPFSDPSRPRMIKCSLISGSITVKGYNGKDVIVEARTHIEDRRHRRDTPVPPGMHRIDSNATGLTVEESDNTVSIGARPSDDISVTVQAPFATSLKLHAVNGGDIVVDNITGDIEVDNTNGNVTVNHISGSAILHALNGKVLATLDKVSADKAMSFSSLNGDIDVTLPADLKAKVKLKSDNGEILSEFDVKLDSNSHQPIVEDNRAGRGKYRVRFDKVIYGTINGGGPEMQFTTFNGNVYIRKGK